MVTDIINVYTQLLKTRIEHCPKFTLLKVRSTLLSNIGCRKNNTWLCLVVSTNSGENSIHKRTYVNMFVGTHMKKQWLLLPISCLLGGGFLMFNCFIWFEICSKLFRSSGWKMSYFWSYNKVSGFLIIPRKFQLILLLLLEPFKLFFYHSKHV